MGGRRFRSLVILALFVAASGSILSSQRPALVATRPRPILIVSGERIRLERGLACEGVECLEMPPAGLPADELAFLRFRRPAGERWVVQFRPVGRDAVEQPAFTLEGTRTDLRTPRVGGRYRLDVRPAAAPPEAPTYSALVHARLPAPTVARTPRATGDPLVVLLVLGAVLLGLPLLFVAFGALFVSSVGMVLTMPLVGLRKLLRRKPRDRAGVR